MICPKPVGDRPGTIRRHGCLLSSDGAVDIYSVGRSAAATWNDTPELRSRRNLRWVSTVIDAAWIGVAGVAVGGLVAVTQTVVNGRISRRVAATTVEGEHRQRLWEKQSAAYEVTVRAVLERRARREALTGRGDVGNIGSHPVEELRKAEEPEGIQTRAAMRAYASEAV